MNNKIKLFKPDPIKLRVKVLGNIGFSARYISKILNLSLNEVNYRLYSQKVKLTNFRNGKTKIAQTVSGNALKYSDQIESENYKNVRLLR